MDLMLLVLSRKMMVGVIVTGLVLFTYRAVKIILILMWIKALLELADGVAGLRDIA